MRRASPIVSSLLSRTFGATNGAVSTASGTLPHGLLQAELYSTAPAGGSSHSRRQWFNRFSPFGISGAAVASLFTATSISQEVLAKEKLPREILPKDVVLYQYETCPFCNKVKAFLDYYDIPYKVVEVNPIGKKEIKWSDYKKVPILMVDGEQLVDSSAIIDQLGEKIHHNKVNHAALAPDSTDDEHEEERKWRRWVDDHLVHVLSPNIYRNSSEALESFDYITSTGNFSFSERITAKYAGAVAMYFVSKKLKKKYNITDERAALYSAAETWVNALNGREFLGGSRPNLADLATFGVLRPIRHLRSGKDMIEHTRIGEWYARMENAVGESSRIKA